MNIRKLFLKKSVATETLYFLLSNIAFAFIPFLLLPFLTEVLSTQEYGQIAIFSLLTAVVSTFVGLNLHGAIAVYCHKYKEDINDYIQNSIYISTFVLFLSILLVYIFNSFLVQFTGLNTEYLFYVPLVSYFQHNINLYLVKIQNDFNAKLYAYLKVSQGVFEGLLTYVLVYEYEMGVIGRIYSAVFISVIYFLFIFWTNSKEIKSFKLNILFSKKLLNFGIPLIPHAFFTIVMSISDRFIIANKLNLSEAGIYMLGIQLASAIVILNDSINRAFKPWLYNLLKDITAEKKIRIVKFSYFYTVLNIFLSICYYLIIMFIFDLIIDPKFSEVKSILHILILGGCFVGFYYNFASFLFFYNRNFILSVATSIIGICALLLNLAFISNYGLPFAAIIYALSQFVLFIFCFVISASIMPLPWTYFLKK